MPTSPLLTLHIPKEYGYVLLVTSVNFVLGVWHGVRVTGFRKAAKVKYPTHQADSAEIAAATPEQQKAMYLFNCAQRTHSNYLENQHTVSIATLVAGLAYPRTAAALGLGWAAGRVIYALGYTDSNKQNGAGRLRGSFFWLFQVGLIGLVAFSGVQMLLS